MKIYVSHASSFDYRAELYAPLQAHLTEHELFLPHEKTNDAIDTKEALKNSDLIVAEVSYTSTGQGIELGWANDADVPIVCIHRHNTKPSSALKIVSNKFISYSSDNDLIEKLQEIL